VWLPAGIPAGLGLRDRCTGLTQASEAVALAARGKSTRALLQRAARTYSGHSGRGGQGGSGGQEGRGRLFNELKPLRSPRDWAQLERIEAVLKPLRT
jgi:hypothetical protein